MSASQDVFITALGCPPVRHTARIRNVSGSGLGLQVDAEIPAGTALRIDLEDALMLGEVMFCRREENAWFLGVQLEQMLRGLDELSRALEDFREAPVRP